MLNIKEIKMLGTLTKEQKETTWKTSLSGSQAWMLVNEPYNLLRDKLGIERIHKSADDVFDLPNIKKYSESAMANGTMYEPKVMEEVRSFHPDEDLRYTDTTYELVLNDNNTDLRITGTPDWVRVDKQGKIDLVGDIKCSKSAEDEMEIRKRYLYQLVHNCIVLGYINSAEIDAKGYITTPLNKHTYSIPQEYFDFYEQRLLEFIKAYETKNETFFDDLYTDIPETELETNELDIGELVEYVANEKEAIELQDYIELKQQYKALEEKIKFIEEHYKKQYDNVIVHFNGNVLRLTTNLQKGTVDYAAMCKVLNIPQEFIDTYRKTTSKRKTIKIETGE